MDLIPGVGRSPGEGKGYPLQYSGLENSTDYIAHGVTNSQTQRVTFTPTIIYDTMHETRVQSLVPEDVESSTEQLSMSATTTEPRVPKTRE